jgi:tRNA modification GTPase
VLLFDIAGLHDSEDDITESTQISAQNAINKADLVLWCIGPGDSMPSTNKNTLVIKTKSDLRNKKDNSICAKTGAGIEHLRKQVAYLLEHTASVNVDAVAILPRHEEQLLISHDFIIDAIVTAHTPELCAACMRDSLQALGKITGKITPDDVLEHVFASFCVGK